MLFYVSLVVACVMENETLTNLTDPFVLPLTPVERAVSDVVEPLLLAKGYELVRAKVTGGGRHLSLALYIDHPEPANIGLGQLESLSHVLSAALDVADAEQNLFGSSYQLEVSSPGLNRPLTRKSHFQKVIGQTIKVKGSPSATGKLISVSETGIVVLANEKPVEVSWNTMKDANQVYEFSNKNFVQRR